MNKVMVISGAGGGIGSELCRQYLNRGWQVAALDLSERSLARLTDTTNNNEQLSTYALDLTQAQDVDAVCTRILGDLKRIDGVIHCAGITQLHDFADTPLAVAHHVMAVNFFAALNLTSATIHALRKSQGVHIAVTSVAGFTPLIRRSIYAASKHAMTGFFSSLRAEEVTYGVDVVIVAPSFVATNLDAPPVDPATGLARPGQAKDGVDYMNTASAVTDIIKAIDKRRPMTPIGRVAKLAWYLQRLSPSLMAAIMRRKMIDD